MRIGVDARFYGPAAKGLGRYVERLLAHLERQPGDNDFVVFLRAAQWDAYQPRDPRFRKVLADVPWYSLAEQLRMPAVLHRERLDLMHFPHYNVPLLFRGPFVVTIHDLIVSRYPTRRASRLGLLPFLFKQLAYRVVIASAVRRARTILTVSEFSKSELRSIFRVPASKIVVTYEAADPPVASSPAHNARWAALQPYLLYVGNAFPHKNLEGLLHAFRLLRARGQGGLRLVLVGKMEHFYERLRRMAQRLGLADAVVFPGYVPDDALASLYRNATLYVFPSFDEGFGLPPLEAMAAGTPVASSDHASLPEILGDAAAYFNPDSPEEMAQALHALLADSARLAALRARGAQRIRRYSWDALAKTTLDVYTGHVVRHAA